MIGSTCDTVVSSVAGPTRSPICAVAMAATPSMSDVTFVNPRLSCAVSTAAVADLHGGLRRQVGLDVVVELALRDGALLGERPVALEIALGLPELRLRLGELRSRLRQHGLERPWIDLEQHLPLANERALLVGAPHQVAAETCGRICALT